MDYRQYVIKTYKSTGEGSRSNLRANPISGQDVPTDIKVECSTPMRHSEPEGTFFKLRAKVIPKKGATILYSHYNSAYEVISETEAKKFVQQNFR